VDIRYTGLETDVVVTSDILPTISGWLLVLEMLLDNTKEIKTNTIKAIICQEHKDTITQNTSKQN